MSSRSMPAKDRDEGKLLFTGNRQLLTFLSGHQLQTPNHIPRDYCVSPARMDCCFFFFFFKQLLGFFQLCLSLTTHN